MITAANNTSLIPSLEIQNFSFSAERITHNEIIVTANLKKEMVSGAPYAASALPEAQLKPQHVMLSTMPNRKIESLENRFFIAWKSAANMHYFWSNK